MASFCCLTSTMASFDLSCRCHSQIVSDQIVDQRIVNRNTDMVRKAGKLQRLSAEMLTYLFAFVTWYAKVHICVVSKE